MQNEPVYRLRIKTKGSESAEHCCEHTIYTLCTVSPGSALLSSALVSHVNQRHTAKN